MKPIALSAHAAAIHPQPVHFFYFEAIFKDEPDRFNSIIGNDSLFYQHFFLENSFMFANRQQAVTFSLCFVCVVYIFLTIS